MTNESLISKIATTIMAIDNLSDSFFNDRHNVYLFVRDCRDELASSDDEEIAEAKITGNLLTEVVDTLVQHRR